MASTTQASKNSFSFLINDFIQYLKIENNGGGLGNVRKNLGMVPVNTDYDLFSMGNDGVFESPLSSVSSRDDIVRAGNGGYMGLAKDFE